MEGNVILSLLPAGNSKNLKKPTAQPGKCFLSPGGFHGGLQVSCHDLCVADSPQSSSFAAVGKHLCKAFGCLCVLAFGVTDTPVPLLPAPARSQRVFRGAVTTLVASRGSQEVSLCNSPLVGLFLCLQAHSSTAEGTGNLSRTGLENKPSIPLGAQLGQQSLQRG